MAKPYNLRLIKHRESYTLKQISELLNVHIRTVQTWKQEGLQVMNIEKPFLIMGFDLKDFLSQKIKDRKTKLQANEFYCTKCREAVRSTDNEVWIELSGKTIGNKNSKEFLIKGVCESCNSKLNRFSHEGKLEEIKNTFNVVNLGELGYE